MAMENLPIAANGLPLVPIGNDMWEYSETGGFQHLQGSLLLAYIKSKLKYEHKQIFTVVFYFNGMSHGMSVTCMLVSMLQEKRQSSAHVKAYLSLLL